jgi:hypothetical protein
MLTNCGSIQRYSSDVTISTITPNTDWIVKSTPPTVCRVCRGPAQQISTHGRMAKVQRKFKRRQGFLSFPVLGESLRLIQSSYPP